MSEQNVAGEAKDPELLYAELPSLELVRAIAAHAVHTAGVLSPEDTITYSQLWRACDVAARWGHWNGQAAALSRARGEGE